MTKIKTRWRSLALDLFCWSYLAYLVYNQEYQWAGVFATSVLLLNFIQFKKPNNRIFLKIKA